MLQQILIITSALLAAFSFIKPFQHFWTVWEEPNGYYSHGMLVPILVGYMIWVNRNRLKQLLIKPSWYGLPVLIIGLLIQSSSYALGWEFLLGIAFMITCYGLALSIFGWQWFKVLFIPLSFFIFMIPSPPNFFDGPTARYQLMSTTISTKLLQLVGYNIHNEGNSIISPDLPMALYVDGVCSGLRLLISYITISCAFLYLFKSTWWKRISLLALTLPFTVLLNSLRIAVITMIGFITYSEDSIQTAHEYSAYAVIAVSIPVGFLLVKLFKMNKPISKDWAESPNNNTAKISQITKPIMFAIAALFALSIYANISLQKLFVLPKGILNTATIPVNVLNWSAGAPQVDDTVNKQLFMADVKMYNYINSKNDDNISLLAAASLDPVSLHDPHGCLPGSGLKIIKDDRISINSGTKPVIITCLMTQDSFDSKSLVAYWYEFDGKIYADTVSGIYRMFMIRRLEDMFQLLVKPWNIENTRKSILSRQITWYRFSTVVTTDTKTDEKKMIEFIKEFVANTKNFGE